MCHSASWYNRGMYYDIKVVIHSLFYSLNVFKNSNKSQERVWRSALRTSTFLLNDLIFFLSLSFGVFWCCRSCLYVTISPLPMKIALSRVNEWIVVLSSFATDFSDDCNIMAIDPVGRSIVTAIKVPIHTCFQFSFSEFHIIGFYLYKSIEICSNRFAL